MRKENNREKVKYKRLKQKNEVIFLKDIYLHEEKWPV